MLTNAGAVAVANPRGAYAPLLLLNCRERLPAKKRTTFAMYKRTPKTHGGLTPPRFELRANGCRRKNDFCDVQTHAEKERRASARRGSGHSNVVRDMPQISCKRVGEATVGSRRPLLLCDAAPGRKITTSVLHHAVRKSGGRQPAVGSGNVLAGTLPQSRGRLPALCSRTPVQ
jgi:hypothetical protein